MPKLDHVNIEARDGAGMVRFLEAVLGAADGPRPPFPFPGHWLYLDGVPVIHVNYSSRADDFPRGMIDHFAFGLFDYGPTLARVEASGYRFEHAGIPGGVGQIFVFGPEGVKIELQYERLAPPG